MKEQLISRINNFVNVIFAQSMNAEVTAAIIALPFEAKYNAVKETAAIKSFESGLQMTCTEALA
jgi:hypothetical protein